MNRFQSNSSAAKLEKVGAESLCGGRMWLDTYVCVPCSRALLSTLWLQIKLYSHTQSPVIASFVSTQTAALKELSPSSRWGHREPQASGMHAQQGSLPSVHKPGERATVLLEEAVFNSQRLLEWSCAVVHLTPQWPSVSRSACTSTALCLTLAARAGVEWLHWPLGGSYNKWLWVTAEFARKNRAAYTIGFGLSCR